MTYSERLEDMGYNEREAFIKILMAWQSQGLPDCFWPNGVRVGSNSASGYVFLTNDEYQTCMLRDGSLAMWYNLPYSGEEGFLEDLMEYYLDLHEEDREHLHELASGENTQIVLCVGKDVGSVCYCPEHEEFGVVKGEQEAWFPLQGTCDVIYVQVDSLPEGESDED